jgi:hypothetical protein
MRGERVSDQNPPLPLEMIRDEVVVCLGLLQEGSPATAAVKLTKLRWQLENHLAKDNPHPDNP